MARAFNIGSKLEFDGFVGARRNIDALLIEDNCTALDTVKWSTVDDSGTGTNAVIDTAGGGISILTAAADNDYHAMTTPGEPFKFQDGKITYAYIKASVTEGNTDAANVIMGFMDTTTTGGLVVNGGGPLASYDGAVFFKTESDTKWSAEVSDAGTQTTNTSIAAYAASTAYEFEIFFDGSSTVYFYINGVGVYSATISTTTVTGEMHFLYGVVSAGAAETLNVYKIILAQEL